MFVFPSVRIYRYFEACRLLEAIRFCCERRESGDLDLIRNEASGALDALRNLLSNADQVAVDMKKRHYLRRYTVSSVLCAALTCCVEFLKEVDKTFVVEVLKLLAYQEFKDGEEPAAASIYLSEFRGYWYFTAIDLFHEKPREYSDEV